MPGNLPTHSTDTKPWGNKPDGQERQKRQWKKTGRWENFAWQKKPQGLFTRTGSAQPQKAGIQLRYLRVAFLSLWTYGEPPLSYSPSASWACQSQSEQGVLPGWDPAPCHPHHRSRRLCRNTEEKERLIMACHLKFTVDEGTECSELWALTNWAVGVSLLPQESSTTDRILRFLQNKGQDKQLLSLIKYRACLEWAK